MQGQAALLQREIEAKLANRLPAALSLIAQQAPRLHPIGNARLDSLLGGGLPLGSVCELTGPDGSGRSSIALSLLASASTEGACAYPQPLRQLAPAKFFLIEGALQNLDKVIHIRAKHIEELDATSAPMVSHDFH